MYRQISLSCLIFLNFVHWFDIFVDLIEGLFTSQLSLLNGIKMCRSLKGNIASFFNETFETNGSRVNSSQITRPIYDEKTLGDPHKYRIYFLLEHSLLGFHFKNMNFYRNIYRQTKRTS